MLAQFTIDPDAVSQDTLALLRHQDLLRQLATLWFELGVLTLPNSQICPLIERIGTLPQSIKVQWQALLVAAEKEKRIRRVPASWPARYSLQNRAQIQALGKVIQLLFASQRNTRDLGVAEHEESGYPLDPALEVCSFEFPSAAKTFSQLRASRLSAHIKGGETVLNALRRLFSVQAEQWGEVVVADRYGLNRFMNRTSTSGVENLLAFLDSVPKTRVLTVFWEKPQDTDFEGELARLKRIVQRFSNGLSSFTIRLVSSKAFKVQHFRYLRFGGEVCVLDEGLQAFDGTIAERVYAPCSFRRLDSHIVEAEKTLRAASEERTIFRAKQSPITASTARSGLLP